MICFNMCILTFIVLFVSLLAFYIFKQTDKVKIKKIKNEKNWETSV